MKRIEISAELTSVLPNFKIGAMSFICEVKKSDGINELINDIQNNIRNKYSLSDVLEIPNIKSARNGYKALGKDPSRYRLAVESLFRRIVKGNDLYRINDAVDLGNVLSLLSERSIAVLDEDRINGDILIRIGKQEPYEGIGRGQINIENIPVYSDDIGPFGSPTSDTERTMITSNTKNVLVFIISFNGNYNLQDNINQCISLYEKYTGAHNFITQII